MSGCLIRLYRLLLLLQPSDVRRRYGAEMAELVRARGVEEGSASFWLREFADLIASTAAARRPAVGWVLVGSAIAHTGYAVAVYPESSMGIAAVVLTAGSLLIGVAMTGVARRVARP